jgi:L-fuculose-phosphate aldolase
VLPYVKDTDTILLANHGTVTYGTDLEDAYFKTEIIDAYCRILILAKQIGRVHYYTDEKAAELIKLKPKLGIADPRLERGLENCDLCGNSLFREGYGEPAPEPRVFIHPKIAGSVPDVSPIESLLTPLAVDMARAESSGGSAPHGSYSSRPSANGLAQSTAPDQEALVQAITDQVMRALNGTAR